MSDLVYFLSIVRFYIIVILLFTYRPYERVPFTWIYVRLLHRFIGAEVCVYVINCGSDGFVYETNNERRFLRCFFTIQKVRTTNKRNNQLYDECENLRGKLVYVLERDGP